MEGQNSIDPLVSVGVPVFNGDKSLSRALDSLIGQTYRNLEIVISDNASTDDTRSICEAYAARDARVKYYRYEENRGAIWNFNNAFGLSSGKYFMWAAHDDDRDPAFISACVEKMEQCPDAVLCQVHTALFIEARDEMLCLTNLDSLERVSGLTRRYRESLYHLPATVLYGLYRSSAVRKTKLLRKTLATDIAFTQELSIHGRFVQVPRVLFRYHGRKEWNTVEQDYRIYFGKEKPWWYLPFVAQFMDHCARVATSRLELPAKLMLWGVLVEHQARRLALKVFIKLTGRVSPRRWKERAGRAIYRRWMLSPNVQVGSESLFMERVIKPSLGWWR